MAETEVLPTVRVETVWNRDKRGQPTSKKFDHVVGLPGGPPDAAGLIILMPIPGVEEREIFTDVISGQTYFRSWRKERLFAKSPNFPDGVDVGFVCHHTDTGTGVPFEERADPQCGPDGLDRLRAYAYGEPYLAMHERRRLAEETDQWRAETRAAGTQRPTTKSPTDALQDVADARIGRMISNAVQKGVAEELAKRDAASKKGGAA